MKNNIQKNEIRISLLNKINGIRKLTKSQKSDLEIGLDMYLQIILCGNIGSESWCEENLNKNRFCQFRYQRYRHLYIEDRIGNYRIFHQIQHLSLKSATTLQRRRPTQKSAPVS